MLDTNSVYEGVKKALSPYKMMELFSTWERHMDEWKLVYSVYGLTIEEEFVIHTRLVFLFNKDKTELVEDVFLILTNLDCNYQPVSIGSDLSVNVIESIKSVGNVGTVKELGDFFVSGTDGFNRQLALQGIENFEMELKYVPNTETVNCFNQHFNFTLTDQLSSNKFKLERNEFPDGKYGTWHCSIAGTSFNVQNLTEDIYKQIVETLYK